MTMHVKDAASWKELQEAHVKDAGVWKQALEVWVKDAGVWKQALVAGPQVSPSSTNVVKTKFTSPGSAYAVVEFNSDGIEYQNNAATSNVATVSRGNWLDDGAAGEVWIQRVINFGSLNFADPGSGRLQLSTTRTFGVTRAGNGTTSCTATFNFYDASSGGNLIGSATITLTATEDAL